MIRRGVPAVLACLVALAFLACPRTEAPAPKLWVSDNGLSFDLGESSAAFLVRNDGPEGSTLSFRVQADVPWLKIESALQFGLKPGESRTVTVSLDTEAMLEKTLRQGRLNISVLGAPQFHVVAVSAAVDLAPPPGMRLYPYGTYGSQALSILSAPDGGYLLFVWRDFDTAHLEKLDEAGNLLWRQSYDDALYSAVCVAGGSRYALVGEYFTVDDETEEEEGVLVLRFVDLNGAPLESYTYAGFYEHYCTNVLPQPDGGCILVVADMDPDTYRDMLILLKVDESGNELWRHAFPPDADWWPVDAAQAGNALYVLGDLDSYYDGDSLLLRTDLMEVESAVAPYAYTGFNFPYGIAAADDGRTALAGRINDLPGLLVLDPLGQVLWTRAIGSAPTGAIYNALALADGGFLALGATHDQYMSQPGRPVPDRRRALVGRVSTDGNVLWAREYGGILGDSAVDAVATGNGYVVLGITRTYGPGAATPFVIFLDQTGNVVSP